VIVTGSCAVYLVAAKRYAELGRARARPRAGHAPALFTRRLRLVLLAAASVAAAGYIGWPSRALAPGVVHRVDRSFLLWLARYATLIGAGAGEAPEDLILRDRALLLLSSAWESSSSAACMSVAERPRGSRLAGDERTLSGWDGRRKSALVCTRWQARTWQRR